MSSDCERVALALTRIRKISYRVYRDVIKELERVNLETLHFTFFALCVFVQTHFRLNPRFDLETENGLGRRPGESDPLTDEERLRIREQIDHYSELLFFSELISATQLSCFS